MNPVHSQMYCFERKLILEEILGNYEFLLKLIFYRESNGFLITKKKKKGKMHFSPGKYLIDMCEDIST
jgi:hypothetical protein